MFEKGEGSKVMSLDSEGCDLSSKIYTIKLLLVVRTRVTPNPSPPYLTKNLQ